MMEASSAYPLLIRCAEILTLYDAFSRFSWAFVTFVIRLLGDRVTPIL